MIEREDLKGYLPSYYQDVLEMNELLNVENELFEVFRGNITRAFNSLSPVTADEESVTIFERFFELVGQEGDTLDRRRMRVLSALVFRPPYTTSYLKERITALGTTVQIREFFNQYSIEITTSFKRKGEVDELPFLYARIIPSNLEVISLNQLGIEATGFVRTWSLNAYTIINVTTSDFEAEYISEGFLNTGQSSQVWKELVTE